MDPLVISVVVGLPLVGAIMLYDQSQQHKRLPRIERGWWVAVNEHIVGPACIRLVGEDAHKTHRVADVHVNEAKTAMTVTLEDLDGNQSSWTYNTTDQVLVPVAT